MRILPFPGRLSAKAKAPVRDWSTQEIADFYRAHRLLAENGAGIGIDRGLSDEGEPWMVFFDVVSQDVFLHIARIDGICQLICEPFNMRLDAADIPSLIAQFEHSVRDYLAIRTDRAKNVVIHPAARIIMSISAVFLLFKLENGEAYAKGFSDKPTANAPDRATEKVSPLARAQAAFQRAFDGFEPAHAAMVAGIILASELVVSSLRNTETKEADVEKLMALAMVEPVVIEKVQSATLDTAVAEAAAHHVPKPVSAEMAVANLVVAIPKVIDDPDVVHFTPPDAVVQIAAYTPPQTMPAPAASNAVSTLSQAASEANVPSIVETDIPDSKKLLLDLFGPEIINTVSPANQPAPEQELQLVSVTIENLQETRVVVGFAVTMDLSLSELFGIISFFKSNMAGTDFDYQGNHLMIEEEGLEGLDASKIGVFTGIAEDGSLASVVGRIDLIDDALTFFA